MNESGEGGEMKDGGAGRVLTAMIDAFAFLAVLVFSALAVIVIAFAAPLAIAISALAGGLAPQRRPRRWRGAHAG